MVDKPQRAIRGVWASASVCVLRARACECTELSSRPTEKSATSALRNAVEPPSDCWYSASVGMTTPRDDSASMSTSASRKNTSQKEEDSDAGDEFDSEGEEEGAAGARTASDEEDESAESSGAGACPSADCSSSGSSRDCSRAAYVCGSAAAATVVVDELDESAPPAPAALAAADAATAVIASRGRPDSAPIASGSVGALIVAAEQRRGGSGRSAAYRVFAVQRAAALRPSMGGLQRWKS